MKGRLLLDVVIRQRAPILQLLASEDQALLVWWNTLLILNLRLHVVNRIRRFDLQRDGLPRQRLHENLHSTTETKNEMEGGLFLDIVVRKCPPILELLAREDETLLIWWNTLLVLDFRLHVINSVGRFHFKGDGLPSQGLDKDLHTTTQTEDEMESRLLLNVVVGERAAVLELLASKDQALLVWGDALLVLNLRLDVVDSIGRLNLKSNCLAGEARRGGMSSVWRDQRGWCNMMV